MTHTVKNNRITLVILGEKIDNLHDDVKEIKLETQKNTKFRYQAGGVLATLTFIAGAVGAFVMWILDKFLGKK